MEGGAVPATVRLGEEEESEEGVALTHPATSVWYSVDEEGNFKDEQETEIKKEKVSQLSQPPSSSRSRVDWRDSQASSSQSAGASSTARRLTTELRSVQGREEQGRDCWMQSAQ